MTRFGKYNLAGVLGLPLVAMLGSVVVFGVRPDTQIFVFVTNAIPMLIGGAVSAFLLRSAHKADAGQWVALWPTLVPAVAGTLWYLYGMAALGSDSGREYFAGPFYLLAGTLVIAVVAIFAFIMTRSRHV